MIPKIKVSDFGCCAAGALFLFLAGGAQAVSTTERFEYRVPVPMEQTKPQTRVATPATVSLTSPLLSALRIQTPATAGLDPAPLPVSRIPFAPAQIADSGIVARPVVHPTKPAAEVPDGGPTGLLLGLALGGLGWLRNQFKPVHRLRLADCR